MNTLIRKYTIILIIFLIRISTSNANSTMVIEIDGKVIDSPKSIVLNADYHEVIFHFPANHNPQNIFQYRLSNLENAWKNSPFPLVRYTNLNGGNYIFRGRIISQNAVVKTYSVPFIIKENFWSKWWFLGFMAVMIITIVSIVIYFWFLYDFRQRMKVEAIRQRIAADLHDEVGANLSSITFFIELLRKQMLVKNEKANLLLDRIAKNSMESASLINDTIWALNPNYDSFEKLIERVGSFGYALFSSKDIAFSIENNLTHKDLDLSIDQRQNLYLILKESINNIAKHSQAKKVFLLIKETVEGIEIIIEDDGIGFDVSETHQGNGLKNYQLRATDSEIEVKVVSEKEKGTAVNVFFVHKNH